MEVPSFRARFYGEIYDVKPTKIIKKKVKHHYDFNGYEVDPHTITSQQWGMFLNGELKYTVKRWNNSFQVYSGNSRIGSISPIYGPRLNPIQHGNTIIRK